MAAVCSAEPRRECSDVGVIRRQENTPTEQWFSTQEYPLAVRPRHGGDPRAWKQRQFRAGWLWFCRHLWRMACPFMRSSANPAESRQVHRQSESSMTPSTVGRRRWRGSPQRYESQLLLVGISPPPRPGGLSAANALFAAFSRRRAKGCMQRGGPKREFQRNYL